MIVQALKKLFSNYRNDHLCKQLYKYILRLILKVFKKFTLRYTNINFEFLMKNSESKLLFVKHINIKCDINDKKNKKDIILKNN